VRARNQIDHGHNFTFLAPSEIHPIHGLYSQGVSVTGLGLSRSLPNECSATCTSKNPRRRRIRILRNRICPLALAAIMGVIAGWGTAAAQEQPGATYSLIGGRGAMMCRMDEHIDGQLALGIDRKNLVPR
jgi:hypothetical protein